MPLRHLYTPRSRIPRSRAAELFVAIAVAAARGCKEPKEATPTLGAAGPRLTPAQAEAYELEIALKFPDFMLG